MWTWNDNHSKSIHVRQNELCQYADGFVSVCIMSKMLLRLSRLKILPDYYTITDAPDAAKKESNKTKCSVFNLIENTIAVCVFIWMFHSIYEHKYGSI